MGSEECLDTKRLQEAKSSPLYLKSLAESCGATLLLMGVMVMAKIVLLRAGATFRWDEFITLRYCAPSYFLYLAWSPIQELLFRGILQNRLKKRLEKEGKGWLAIPLTALLFCSIHVHLSSAMVFVTFALGLLWGWLYQRHGTILGVSISHFVLGDFAGFLGLWDYFIKP